MPNSTITLDRYTRGVLTALAGLLTVLIVELWVGMPGSAPTAQAQIPDTGLQRQNLVQETQKTNELLQKIYDQLKTGTIKVKTETADKRIGKKDDH